MNSVNVALNLLSSHILNYRKTVDIKLYIFLANKRLRILVKHHVLESSIKSPVFAPVGRRTTMSVSRNFSNLHNGRNRLFCSIFSMCSDDIKP